MILDTNADSPQPLLGGVEYDLKYFLNNPYVSGFEKLLGEELGLQAEESAEEFLRYLRNEFGVGVRDYDRKALVLRILNLLKFLKIRVAVKSILLDTVRVRSLLFCLCFI